MNIVFIILLVVMVLWKQDIILNIITNDKIKKKSYNLLYEHYYIGNDNTIIYFNEIDFQKLNPVAKDSIRKGVFINTII